MVKLDQLLSQWGEGTSNTGMTSSGGKNIVEESMGSRLESRMTESHWADNGQRWDSRVRQLELPTFYGTNHDGWVFCVERFFNLNVMPENTKLEAAILSMEGEAIAWF